MADDCYQLGVAYHESGKLQGAEAMYRRALVLCESLRDHSGVAAAYSRLDLLFEMYGEIGQARFFLEEARAIHQAINDTCGLASDLGYLGFLHFAEGNHDDAETLFRQAPPSMNRVDNRSKQAEDCGNLGNLLCARKQLDEAEQRCITPPLRSMRRSVPDKKGIGGQYRSLGICVWNAVTWLRRESSSKLGMKLHKEEGWLLGVALQCDGLGRTFEESDPEKAEKLFNEALTLYEAAGHKPHVSRVHRRLGGPAATERRLRGRRATNSKQRWKSTRGWVISGGLHRRARSWAMCT